MRSFAIEKDLKSMEEHHYNDKKGVHTYGGKEKIIHLKSHITINKARFEEVFNLYYDGLFRYCNTMIADKESVEDIVQNVFTDLWQERDTLVIHTSIQAYLYKSVYFKCMNAFKHGKVVHKFMKEHTHSPFMEESDPAILTEVAETIHKTTESLPEQCRKIFKMSRVEGLRYNEIAETLNLSPKTVENQMGKALKTMREALVEYLHLIVLTIISFLP
jgi:RNA polymerase sigma-70 factor, ECF subfamily